MAAARVKACSVTDEPNLFPSLFEGVTTNLSRCVLSYLRIHPGLAPSQGRAFDGGCVPVSAVPVFAQPPFVERNGGRPGFGLPSHRCRGVLLGSLLPSPWCGCRWEGKGVHWRPVGPPAAHTLLLLSGTLGRHFTRQLLGHPLCPVTKYLPPRGYAICYSA